MKQVVTITLPDIGEGVVEGEVIEWLKEEGDSVALDEPIVVVMTDKATVELPSPYPGKLAKQHHAPGDTAYRDKPLYDVEVAAGTALKQSDQKIEQPTDTPSFAPREQATQGSPYSSSAPGCLATPAVRHMAKQLGINLTSLQGSGPDGRILPEDLRPAVSSVRQSKPPLLLEDDTIEPMVGIRRLTAEHMAASKQTAPHFSYFDAVDATRVVRLRQKVKEEAAKEEIKLTYMPFFIKALSLLLKQFPILNSSVDGNSIRYHQPHHIGIAMAAQDGLIVPVLKHVETMNLADVIRSFDELKRKALSRQLEPREMQGSTITISNFGTLGRGIFATPIINIPEVAILGVNRIRPQPLVYRGDVVARDVLNISWSFDHRVIDGDTAAAASTAYAQLLENPGKLL